MTTTFAELNVGDKFSDFTGDHFVKTGEDTARNVGTGEEAEFSLDDEVSDQ